MAAPGPAPLTAPQVTWAPVATAPARRREMGTGAKIGIGIAAAIGAIIVVAVIFGVFVAAHVKQVHLADGQTRVETPFGDAMTGQPSNITARRLGIPVYPGASAEGSVTGSLGSLHGAILRFRTHDSPQQVLMFYQRHYAGSAITASEFHTPQLTLADHGYKLTVTAQPQDGETEIVIVRGRQ